MMIWPNSGSINGQQRDKRQNGKIQVKCDANGNRSMDEATRWLFYFGEPGLRLPENGRQLPKYCRWV